MVESRYRNLFGLKNGDEIDKDDFDISL